ncbi:hypothetical protein K8S19_07160 [bacterium]|nr:hypothetical protein [bacterium]
MDFSMQVHNIPLKMDHLDSYANRNVDKTQSAKEAFQSFEALFISTILSEMSSATKTGLSGKKKSMEEEWAWTMMIQTISQEMAAGEGLGLGKLLLENESQVKPVR